MSNPMNSVSSSVPSYHSLISQCPYSVRPDQIHSYKSHKHLSILHSCQSVKELKQVHSLIIKTCPSPQTHQEMYSKILSLCAYFTPFPDLGYLHTLLAQLPDPDFHLYNTLICCFSRSKFKEDHVIVWLSYCELIRRELVVDSYTYPFVLKACARSRAFREGEMVHARAIKDGFVLDLYVFNTLVRFYAALGSIEDARRVFDGSSQRDMVSWTTLIQGYVEKGDYKEGIGVFYDMCESGYEADERMMAVVISACARLGDLSLGRKLHEYVIDHNVNRDVIVWNALVDLYLKCGDADSARKIFREMPVKNVVSWNAMISGLVQKGEFTEALNMFRKMQRLEFKPDDITLSAVLNACANLGLLELGKWVHYYLDRNQIRVEGLLGNALIHMYAKCGSLIHALGVFESMKCRDVYAYTAVISGLAMNGEGEMALERFSEMVKSGIQPNGITFVGLLSACSHSGLLNQGQQYFADMSRVYNVRPQIEHYGCMVDLFGRLGLLTEAMEFIKGMPVEPDYCIWGTILGACQLHGNSDLAESVMGRVSQTEPSRDDAYVIMSNIYASANKWKEAFQLRKTMKTRKLKKNPGCSSIEVNGIVHEFRRGDKAHPNIDAIYAVLDIQFMMPF